MLEKLFGKYLGLAKLVAVGGALLAIAGFIILVDGWRHDSLALPAVKAERDAAIAQKAELEKYTVGAFTNITAGIEGLSAKWAKFETGYVADMASIDAAVAIFKRNTANVQACPLPGSPDDLLVRRGLLQLLANPDTGAIGRSGERGGEGTKGAAVPGGAAPADNVPGRPAGAADQQGLVVPAAGAARRGHPHRAAQRRRRRSDRLGAKGAGQKVRPGRMGKTVSCRIRVTCGIKHRKAAERFAAVLSEALGEPVPVHSYG